MRAHSFWTLLLISIGSAAAQAEEIASVNTNWKLFGSDKVVVEVYDDPKVQGVACYVSRAKTGGLSGAVGVAEDVVESSIACRQVGPIRFTQPLKNKEEVFSERLSILFKELHVLRLVDAKRNTLVYFTYSDRIISGSPQNSVTAVPVGTTIPVK
ncbi:MAG TPA: CreA family protein [Burkholderiales bacterium]|nr:CreA family protein [Burkholderiales bacterium]